MGQNSESSQAHSVLEGQDIPSLAKYIQSERCRNVFLMIGAGISTAAGIPDFRSPGTGLYSNLSRLNLPFPEAVFEISFFRRNPIPFYTLAQELYPGRYRPTLTHSFIRLVDSHNLLHTCFTQNIDTLERRAGVPEHKIVEAHGSFATQRCIECKATYDGEKMRKAVLEKSIPRCPYCNGLVKPDIVFFGEALPPSFHASISSLSQADLLIIMGTSLTVHPFASLVDLVPDKCPRVLINMERVGSIGNKPDDIVFVGKCDDIVRELCRELEWEEELEKLWKETEESIEIERIPESERKKKQTEEERLEKEVQKITEEVGQSLNFEDKQAQGPKVVDAADTPQKSPSSTTDTASANVEESSKASESKHDETDDSLRTPKAPATEIEVSQTTDDGKADADVTKAAEEIPIVTPESDSLPDAVVEGKL